MEKPVICTANQNGSQADCELGNPFKRDSEVDVRPDGHLFILTLSCCASNIRSVFTFSLFIYFKSDHILHHPEHCGYDPRHHRDWHRPAAPNVSVCFFSCFVFSYGYTYEELDKCVFLSFRTSVQENNIPVKVKAKVIIELPLSVRG